MPVSDFADHRDPAQSAAAEPVAETPAVEPEPTPQIPSVKQLRHQLLKAIGAVLQCTATLRAASAEQQQAGDRLKIEEQRSRQYEACFPMHEDASHLERLFERCGAQKIAEVRARLESQRFNFEWYTKAQAKLAAIEQLSIAIEQALSHRPEMADDDVMLAAKHLKRRAYRPKTDGDFAAPPEVALSNETRAQHAQLTVNLRETLKVLAAGVRLARSIEECETQVRDLHQPNIKEPVNLSVEEIQRFLRQLEDFMSRRQKAHRRLHDLLQRKDELLAQVNDHWSKRYADQSGSFGPAGAPEVLAFKQQYKHLVDLLSQTSSSLQHAGRQASHIKLDTRQVAERTAADMSKIKLANKLLHDYAVAAARANQAESGCKRVSEVEERDVVVFGVQLCRNWDECKVWWSKKNQERAAVAAHNLVRSTRIKLAEQTRDHFKKAVKRAATLIHRFLVSTGSYKLWCDDLRALLNAAAWAIKPRDQAPQDKPGKSGQYPVY